MKKIVILLTMVCLSVLLMACSEKKEADSITIYYKSEYTSFNDIIESTGKYSDADYKLPYFNEMTTYGDKIVSIIYMRNNNLYKDNLSFNENCLFNKDGLPADSGKVLTYTTPISESMSDDIRMLLKTEYTYSYGGFVVYDVREKSAYYVDVTGDNGERVFFNTGTSPIYDMMENGGFLVEYQMFAETLSDETNEYGVRPVEKRETSSAIAIINPDGVVTSRIVLNFIDDRMHNLLIDSNELGIQQIRASADGSIYIRTNECIVVISPKDDDYVLAGYAKLEDISDFSEKNINGSDATLDCSEDGIVYLKYPYTAADGRVFYRRCELTPTENPVGEPETLPYIDNYTTIISGDDVYYKTGSGIYYAGKIGGESVTDGVGADDIYNMNSNIVCYWSDIDLYGGMVNYIHVVSKDEIIAEVTDPDTGEDMFVRVTTSDTPVDDRKVLILAYEDGSMQLSTAELQKTVRRFNRSNEDYRVRTVDYRTDESSTANEKLMREIVSGSTPDIVMLGGTITPEIFVRQKAFVNLYDFMKKDDKYTKDAFLPAALKPFENGGKLYYLTTGIIPETIVCDKSVYNGKTLGSAEDFAAISDAAREMGIPLFRSNDKTTPAQPVFAKLLDGVLSECVDYESGKVGLGKDFAELLRVCGEADYEVSDANYYTLEYYEQKAALSFLNMYGIRDYLQQRAMLAKDFSDFHTVGYPVKGGAIIRIASSLAITKRSDDKEGAWEFMKYWLDSTEEQCERAVGNIYEISGMLYFPTTRAAMDNLFTAAKKSGMTIDTFASEDGRYTTAFGYFEMPDNTGNLPSDCIYFTDEDEAYLRDLFETAVTPANADTKLIGIVKEETAAYFAGAQTLDRTVEVISDRVKTRLAE